MCTHPSVFRISPTPKHSLIIRTSSCLFCRSSLLARRQPAPRSVMGSCWCSSTRTLQVGRPGTDTGRGFWCLCRFRNGARGLWWTREAAFPSYTRSPVGCFCFSVSLGPGQAWNLHPMLWQWAALTTGPPGKSPVQCRFWMIYPTKPALLVDGWMKHLSIWGVPWRSSA